MQGAKLVSMSGKANVACVSITFLKTLLCSRSGRTILHAAFKRMGMPRLSRTVGRGALMMGSGSGVPFRRPRVIDAPLRFWC